MRFAELDAVTVDAYGTLVTLRDPLPALERALRDRGIARTEGEIRRAFAAEAAYYRLHTAEGRDVRTLAVLRRECAGVFLEAIQAEHDPEEFAPAYAGALEFEALPGVRATLSSLRARGLELAVVGNWDVSLADRLAELGLAHFFAEIVFGARKPGPEGLLEALAELGVAPGRAAHVGDEEADEAAAKAAGVRYLPAPLAAAFERWA